MFSAAAAVVVSTALPSTAGFPTTGGHIRTWQPEFMASSHTYSRAQALAQAKGFDVIVAGLNLYRDHLSAMRAANPDLVVLGYTNGGYSTKDKGRNHPDSWYAHDKAGRKIKSVAFGNYLMNPSNGHWADLVGDRCVAAISATHYDGCFLDSLGPAALQPGYATGVPVNPATGKVWTQTAWMKATSSVARSVKARAGAKMVVVNGVQQGTEYFNSAGSTSGLTSAVDGAMVELFARAPFVPTSQFRSVADWKKDVDMLVDAGSRGRTLLCVTKAWVSGTVAQENALHEYALGTFLLGSNGKSYFSFLYDKTTSRASSYWDANLGAPTGAYSYSQGLYRRAFQRGLVLVNPSEAAVTVPLSRSVRKLNGQVVSGSIRLAPHTAAVLTYA